MGATTLIFDLITPSRVMQVDAFNGGTQPQTVTLACADMLTISEVVPAGATATITTGWTDPCAQIMVLLSDGALTTLDHFVIG